jgi:hypothetical protein
MKLQVTQDGEYIIIDGNDNDALKISQNRNGTLELTFLSTGAWSAGSGRLYGDKKTTVGIADMRAFGHALGLGHASGSSIMKPKVHPAQDMNQDHDWHYEEDPYHYITGVEGLSISTSADRAMNKVLDEIWDGYSSRTIGDKVELFDTIGKLLKLGLGRNYIYRLAGRTKNAGKFTSFSPVSLTTAFKLQAALDGHDID